jgi:hypothetical protein
MASVAPRVRDRGSGDPWRGPQPKYDKIVRLGPMRFGLTTKLPSGEPVTIELGPRFVSPA